MPRDDSKIDVESITPDDADGVVDMFRHMGYLYEHQAVVLQKMADFQDELVEPWGQFFVFDDETIRLNAKYAESTAQTFHMMADTLELQEQTVEMARETGKMNPLIGMNPFLSASVDKSAEMMMPWKEIIDSED